jgi:hypothetical protein
VSQRRRKEEPFGAALLLKPHEAVAEGGVAVETVGGNGERERCAKRWVRARRRPPLPQVTRRELGISVRTVRLTGGPHVVLIFPIYPKPAQL